jgi:hypothetical protein
MFPLGQKGCLVQVYSATAAPQLAAAAGHTRAKSAFVKSQRILQS